MGAPCVHCGEDCGSHPVIWDDKPFCCHGCSTVYQILNQNKLDKYYEIQPMAGIKVDRVESGNKYAYLDNEEISGKLLTFSDGNIHVVNLFVPTIHCASCIWLLENLHTLDAGVIQSSVNFPRKQVSITFNSDEITLRQLVELLVSIHYVPEITLDQLDKKDTLNSSRSLLLKIGIAGFGSLQKSVSGTRRLSRPFAPSLKSLSHLVAPSSSIHQILTLRSEMNDKDIIRVSD